MCSQYNFLLTSFQPFKNAKALLACGYMKTGLVWPFEDGLLTSGVEESVNVGGVEPCGTCYLLNTFVNFLVGAKGQRVKESGWCREMTSPW